VKIQPCGTNAAYNRHIVYKTPPCEPCKAAHSAYRQQHRNRVYLNRGNLMRDATGTRRRIQALMRMGWTAAHIAEVAVPHLSSAGRWVYAVMYEPAVTPATYEAISRAYDALSHRRGPSQNSANRAMRKGWPPPLAWDDIDDPECKPEGFLRPSDYKKLRNQSA
jgi:hypothetical protein